MLVLASAVGCTPLQRDDELLEDVPREVAAWPPVELEDGSSDCLPPDAELRSPVAPHHEDLRLELQVFGPTVIEPGERPRLRATVHNDSTTTSHAFVLPGDGSAVGLREPTVSLSGVVQSPDGCWQPLAPAHTLRCGLFDADWTQDVVVLGPGEERQIEQLWADHTLQFDAPGPVRLRLHFLWNEGHTSKGVREYTPSTTALAGVPAFELTSNVVELTVVQRFGLELRPKPRPEGAPPSTDLRDLLDVRLTNVTDAPQALMRPNANVLRFDLRGSVTTSLRGTWEPVPDKTKLWLAPGASVSLLGDPSPNPDLEYFVDHPVRERVQVRATFYPDPDRRAIRVTSNWTDLDLR